MRIVVKIGTSSVTERSGQIRDAAIGDLCDQVAAARSEGHEVIVVSSGAVAGGVGALGLEERPVDTLTLQALSAVGQSVLMSRYNGHLARHGLVGGQVLLVPHDFIDRSQYLHARATLVRLLELGCVPVINENDAIASDEIRFGDNDRIAALVAHLVRADVLVLLTDTDGLYTADPSRDSSARLVGVVAADDPLLSVRATSSGTQVGSGGMASKPYCATGAYLDTIRVVIPSDLIFVVVSPESEMLTKAARGVLPASLPYFDAVRSINSASYLVAAFATGQFDRLRHAVADFMHEPYRLPSIPGARAAIDAGCAAGALTGWLSGSGSSVLCVCRRGDVTAVSAAMSAAFTQAGLPSVARALTADNEGLRIE